MNGKGVSLMMFAVAASIAWMYLDSDVPLLSPFTLIFGALIVWTLYLGTSVFRNGLSGSGSTVAQILEQGRENQVLALARAQGGTIVESDVRRELGVPEKDARRWLEALVMREALELDVSEEGTLIYRQPRRPQSIAGDDGPKRLYRPSADTA